MNSEILQCYKEVENHIRIIKNNSYAIHVNPTLTQKSPIHNWYRFKEGFSPNLLKEVIRHTKKGDNGKIRILDPFCGSGTTLLSAAIDFNNETDIGIGVEVNPFIHFMANTKLNFAKLNIAKAEKFINNLRSINLKSTTIKYSVPELSTINKAFSNSTLSQLLYLKEIIKSKFHESDYEYNFFMLGYACILEQVSCMRKSGRALKIVRSKEDYPVREIFINKVLSMINDIKKIIGTIQYNHDNFDKLKLLNQDIRHLPIHNNESFNLIVFSPPYLNHFDYTEVYKIELWMLDYVDNYDEFKSLRYKTFRSHPSVKFKQTEIYNNFNSKIIKRLISILDSEEKKEPFYESIKGYIDDMYKTFINLYKISDNDVNIACIVANSLFGSKDKDNFMPVATDLIISEVAQSIGFEIIEIIQARKVTRRGLAFPYGRESVIYMKKRNTHITSLSELITSVL